MNTELKKAHAELAALFPGQIVSLQIHIGNPLNDNQIVITHTLLIDHDHIAEAKSLEDLLEKAKAHAEEWAPVESGYRGGWNERTDDEEADYRADLAQHSRRDEE